MGVVVRMDLGHGSIDWEKGTWSDKTNKGGVEEILLGVDYGGKNTGLAFGRAGLASPMRVISSDDENVVISEISRAALENKTTKVIMGLPLDPEGKDTPQSLVVRRFAKLLKIRLKRPVEFVDESDSSQEAVIGAIHSGISKKARRVADHYSAALLLKRYYNEVAEGDRS